MSTHPTLLQPEPASVLERIGAWLAGTRAHWAALHETAALPPGELERIASDLGVSPRDVREAAGRPAAASELLHVRLHAMGLTAADARAVSARFLADLESACAHCTDKGRCARDLAVDPDGAGWRAYCPNAHDIDALALSEG